MDSASTLDSPLAGEGQPAAQSAARLSLAPSGPVRLDREKLLLYAAALLAVSMVAAVYVFGYLLPANWYGDAIVNAAHDDKRMLSGCYLLWLEHANRLQSAYSLRFLGMLIGTVIAFIGMVFTVKGLEAGYSLDVHSGSNSASLKTASPGLVLCTLGIVLCAAAMLNTSNLTFAVPPECLR